MENSRPYINWFHLFYNWWIKSSKNFPRNHALPGLFFFSWTSLELDCQMLIRLAELMLIKNDIVESITTTLTESRVSFNKLRTMLTSCQIINETKAWSLLWRWLKQKERQTCWLFLVHVLLIFILKVLSVASV